MLKCGGKMKVFEQMFLFFNIFFLLLRNIKNTTRVKGGLKLSPSSFELIIESDHFKWTQSYTTHKASKTDDQKKMLAGFVFF